MTRRCRRAWIVAVAASAMLAGAIPAARADEPLDRPVAAPAIDDEPAPLSAEPPPLDEKPPTERRRRRPREPYKAEEVSPFARNELALAGTVVAGGAYFSTLFVLAPQGFPNGGWPMMIPVVGPWIALTTREVVPGVSHEDSKRAFIVADGVIQSAGAVMFIIGQFLPVTDPMHSGGESFAVAPAVAPGESGLRAWGTF